LFQKGAGGTFETGAVNSWVRPTCIVLGVICRVGFT
jgi:hypothetical protein